MRYIIGIDLGTTNTCISYIDTQDGRGGVQLFKIPQLVLEKSVEAKPTLPSVCYLAAPHEFSLKSLDLPWDISKEKTTDYCVGAFALSQGAKVPTRLVQSAKSWLCHSAANRRDKILPIEAAQEDIRISPVEATTRYLKHIRGAWNHYMGKGDAEKEFDAQEIVLTVPASFDEVARSLTVEAARLAGFSKMTLLEEPQAAFYSWIAGHENNWHEEIPKGATVLVCDVGGGTTDFSLIEVVEKDGKLGFQRMAVGDHLLLGGDNMDAAVAHHMELQLEQSGHGLSALQRLQLHHEARKAKEAVLQEANEGDARESYRVFLQGTGSNVIKGSLGLTIQKEELRVLLVQGFFSVEPWEEALQLKKTTGFRSMGLPYAEEPSITKHLAHFLSTHVDEEKKPKQPDFVLFNGGAMKAYVFQEAVIASLQTWFAKPVKQLSSYHLDLAVARGAAYYGKVRRGLGVRIGGGAARGFYLILEQADSTGAVAKKALTLLPRGSEEGASYEPETLFHLKANTPVRFQLATSHVRLHDASGDLIDVDPKEMQMLPPIQTVLRLGKKQAGGSEETRVPVHIQIGLTPIGTLQLGLKSLQTSHSWQLEFQVRSAAGQEDALGSLKSRDADETFSLEDLQEAVAIIESVFSSGRFDNNPSDGKLSEKALLPQRMMEKLEEALKMPRNEWSFSVMRRLADVLLKMAPQRKLSEEHGIRWWNAMGFLLRPGFGYPLDDFRMKELWKVILSDQKGGNSKELSLQMGICYRRVAGGFSKGQQLQLTAEFMQILLPKKATKIELKVKSDGYVVSEMIRAVAACELIDASYKARLGNALIARVLSATGNNADFWALGRLGGRHLLYGSFTHVLPRALCEEWIVKLLGSSLECDEKLAFLYGQLARRIEQRDLNISKELVDQIVNRFSQTPYAKRLEELLVQENSFNSKERDQIFGDHLPVGLILDAS